MKILLPVISYYYLTGAELYVFELASELIRRGHEVTVVAMRIGGALEGPSRDAGIRVCAFGDQRAAGNFDMIHASEPIPTNWALSAHPFDPLICTIHSQYPCEQPVINPRILHYVCIRPEVQQKVVNIDHIPAAKTSIIFNPVNFQRFRPIPPAQPHAGKRILFCGTVDLLRRQTIVELMRQAERGTFELWILGLKADNYAAAGGYINTLPPNVRWFDQDWNTERFINECDETAGILLGRTTIEGWACGKPGWIFDIDLQGNIRSRALHQPPADMTPFDSVKVVDQIEALYRRYAYKGTR
jgi:glycosyltransferase involved in cell wall biosynthesis